MLDFDISQFQSITLTEYKSNLEQRRMNWCPQVLISPENHSQLSLQMNAELFKFNRH